MDDPHSSLFDFDDLGEQGSLGGTSIVPYSKTQLAQLSFNALDSSHASYQTLWVMG